MAIIPDTKDWTWVLDRPCPECGFDGSTVAPHDVASMIEANAAVWSTILARPGVSERRTPDRWSPLEYGCHVRDVYRLFDDRLGLMLTEDDPRFANWDQDETAEAEQYGTQDPAVVAEQLADAAASIAASFRAVAGDQWDRQGRRSDGARFTVASFSRYLIHDPVHHVWDVES